MKLGKLPVKHDVRTLRMARYLPTRLPVPPSKIDHMSKVAVWPMYDNDKLGDCGPAGAAHQTQAWSTYAGKPLTPTLDQVKAAYFAITGGVDTGVYIIDLMNYWRKTGIGGDKIEAFASIHPNLDELRLAVQLFGSAGLGFSLPDVGTFGPWTKVYGPPNPANGHYVCAVGYNDATRTVYVVSWGRVMAMSYDFFLKYNDEGYAALNDLSLDDTGKSPEGFDYAALAVDISHLHDPVTPGAQSSPSSSTSASTSASPSSSSSRSQSASTSSSISSSASPSVSGSASSSASPSVSGSASSSASPSVSGSASSSASPSVSGSASSSASPSVSASPSPSPSPSSSTLPPVTVERVIVHMSDGTQQTFVKP